MYSQTAAQDASLRASFSSNLGTNLCAVLAKIDELPGCKSACLHSWGKQQKPRFTEQTSTMKGSMCAALLSPPLCAPPELKSLRTPYFPLSIFSHLSAPCQ